MAEPTSARTYRHLLIEVAKHLGIAYYGPDGGEEAQVPQDAYDLAICESAVNGAFRLLIADAPPDGWRWMQPVLSVSLWPSISTDDDVTVTAVNNPADNRTVVTASDDSFYESMEQKTLTVTDVGSYTIGRYTSATVVEVVGQVAWLGSKTFSITADGNYTLPQTFGGSYRGRPNYAAGTNTGVKVDWVHEQVIRQLREVTTAINGDPYDVAVRPLSDGTRRRWELMTYPIPSDVVVLEFAYDLHFDTMTDADDLHPAGYEFDHVVRSACRAMADQENRDMPLAQSEYATADLLKAYRIHARSAPKRLGYCGSGRASFPNIQAFREGTERQTVAFNE